MAKIPECERCQFYAHSSYMVCSVHPFGVEGDSCLDFRANPDAKVEEQWSPPGTRFVDGELVIERSEAVRRTSFFYGTGQPCQRWTIEEMLELLDTHPLFTGRCPQCEMPLHFKDHPIHWDCPCGWMDDTI